MAHLGLLLPCGRCTDVWKQEVNTCKRAGLSPFEPLWNQNRPSKPGDLGPDPFNLWPARKKLPHVQRRRRRWRLAAWSQRWHQRRTSRLAAWTPLKPKLWKLRRYLRSFRETTRFHWALIALPDLKHCPLVTLVINPRRAETGRSPAAVWCHGDELALIRALICFAVEKKKKNLFYKVRLQHSKHPDVSFSNGFMIWQRVKALMHKVQKYLGLPHVITRLYFRNICQQKVQIVMPPVGWYLEWLCATVPLSCSR